MGRRAAFLLISIFWLLTPAFGSTFTESKANSDLTTVQTCNSVSTQGTFAPQVMTTGTATTGSWAFSQTHGTTRNFEFYSPAGVPNSTSWASGTYTVKLNVTVAASSSNMTWQDTCIIRVNSSGTAQATVGSLTAQSISLASTGVKSMAISGSAQGSASASDRIVVVMNFKNAGSSGSYSWTLEAGNTTNDTVATPVSINFTAAPSDTNSVSESIVRGASFGRGPLETFGGSSGGAIAHDVDSYSGEVSSVSSFSWNHTCTGSNGLLVVGVTTWVDYGFTAPSATVTYNGVSMTPISTWQLFYNNEGGLQLLYLAGPATGTHSIAVTLRGTAKYAHAGATSLTGVSQSAALDNSAYASGASGATPTVNITTIANNAWIVDLFAASANNIVISPTIPQIQSWNAGQYVNGSNAGGSYNGPISPAGVTSDGWSSEGSSWGLYAASFAPAGGPMESVARVRSVPVSVSDSVSPSESLGRLASFGRGPVDTHSANESLTRLVGFGRGPGDTYTLAESLSAVPSAGSHPYNANLSDTVGFSESLGRLANLGRGPSDTNTASESVARLRTVPRAFADSASFSESPARLASFGRGPSDTNSSSESLARVTGFGRAASDTHSASESLTRLASFGRAPGDTYSLAESLSAIRNGGSHAFTATLAESFSFSEGTNRTAALLRSAEDENILSESLWGRKILLRGTLKVPGQARKGAVTGSPRSGTATGPPRSGAVSATPRRGTVPKP
jgi:hypothetical protein